MLIYTKPPRSKPKPVSRAVREANERHRAWLKENNYLVEGTRKSRKTLIVDAEDDRKLPPLSNTVPHGVAAKRSIDDHRWKRDLKESPQTIEAIEQKKKRIAPPYSKGAAQYITDGDDPKTLGKKV